MRKNYTKQYRFDSSPIAQVELNVECRDEIICVLIGLQHLYTNSALRMKVVRLVAADINEDSRADVGRPGMDYWQVLVLAAVRLGCNLDFDKLQDQVENHRALRGIMGIGEWEDLEGFNYRTIRETLCLLKPATISKLNEAIVTAGHAIDPQAGVTVRADSFVIETNIHYPSESTLILDGIRKLVPLCVDLASTCGMSGWRQISHLVKKIKKQTQKIGRMAASKSPSKKALLSTAYSELLERAGKVLQLARELVKTAIKEHGSRATALQTQTIELWIDLTSQVCDTAFRRVLLGESVPSSEKLFSLFETHTQLYRRGKVGQANQFGRLALVYEDGAGFISHYHLMDREATDKDVVVEQTVVVMDKHNGAIESASFDRGFYSKENEQALQELVGNVCVLPRAPSEYAERLKTADIKFHKTRLHHSGIESAIGALQRGNGLKRCRDKSEVGFERYFGLGVLGRNIHTLGKLLLARDHANSLAATNRRKAA